jgi:hypothetical protein
MPSYSTSAKATRPSGTGSSARQSEAHLAELTQLATLLDARYRIPGTQWRFGIDAILGLVPGIGDTFAALPALYLIYRAREMGVPNSLLVRMIANVGVDTLVGSVPIAGSVFDVFFKASKRNIALLRRHLEKG